jgi:hypothetical protein
VVPGRPLGRCVGKHRSKAMGCSVSCSAAYNIILYSVFQLRFGFLKLGYFAFCSKGRATAAVTKGKQSAPAAAKVGAGCASFGSCN